MSRVLVGDCRAVMATMEPNSVDAVVTDPPYGLEFMGKEWDRPWAVNASNAVGYAGRDDLRLPSHRDNRNANCRACGGRQRGANRCKCETPNWDRDPRSDMQAFQDWSETWAREALRVLKPGGHLLAFGGTRTFHRMTVAIEDAGFEIRDCLSWLYGSGFPKSLNVGDGRGTALKPAWEPVVLARKPLIGTVAANVAAHGTGALNIDACRIGDNAGWSYPNGRGGRGWHGIESLSGNLDEPIMATKGRWPANVLLDEDAAALLDEQSGERAPGHHPKQRNGRSMWANDGGGLNGNSGPERWLDKGGASRFFYCAKASRAERNAGLEGMPERKHVEGEYLDYVHPAPVGIGDWLREHRERAGLSVKDVACKFPSRTGGLTGCVTNWERQYNRPTPDQWLILKQVLGFDGRYDGVMTELKPVERSQCDNPYLRAKTPRTNAHPTVKPVSLMCWLVRLVTPPDGLVLDPFAGSGTTGVACAHEGFRFLGIEQSDEYAEIARRRIAAVSPLFAMAAD